MATPRKPANGNGRDLVDYREVVRLIGDAKEDLARQVHGVLMRIDALDMQGPRGNMLLDARLQSVEKWRADTDPKIESLELSRAEGKGRAAVIAGVVAVLVSLLMTFLTFGLNRIPKTPAPAPTVVVTVQPQSQPPASLQSQAGPAAPPVIIVYPRATTASQPSASPKPTSSPTSSPPPQPGVLAATCRLIHQAGITICRSSSPHHPNPIFVLPLMLGVRLLGRRKL